MSDLPISTVEDQAFLDVCLAKPTWKEIAGRYLTPSQAKWTLLLQDDMKHVHVSEVPKWGVLVFEEPRIHLEYQKMALHHVLDAPNMTRAEQIAFYAPFLEAKLLSRLSTHAEKFTCFHMIHDISSAFVQFFDTGVRAMVPCMHLTIEFYLLKEPASVKDTD